MGRALQSRFQGRRLIGAVAPLGVLATPSPLVAFCLSDASLWRDKPLPDEGASALFAFERWLGLSRLGVALFGEPFPKFDEPICDERNDMLKGELTVCGHEPVVAHFGKSGGQYVLQVAPHKLEDFEGAGFPFLRVGVLIFKGDVRSGHFKDPAGRNGDTEDILREVVERILSIADVFNVDDPLFLPDDWIGFQLSLFEFIHKDPSK